MTELTDVDKMITTLTELFGVYNRYKNGNLTNEEKIKAIEKIKEKFDYLKGFNYSVAREEEALHLLIEKFKPDLLKIIQEENDFSRDEKQLTESLNKSTNATTELVTEVKSSISNGEKPSGLFTGHREDIIVQEMQTMLRLVQQEAKIVQAREKLAEELRKIIVELKNA